MAKKFAALRAQMSPESQARTEAKAQAMLAEMPLNELRQARGLSWLFPISPLPDTALGIHGEHEVGGALESDP